jgi:glycosyltransferase involved in cell wall biosynthesis
MKIAIVAPGGFDRSGTQRVIPVFLTLARNLATRHEVHVFTLHQYPEPVVYALAGATVHNIGDGGGTRRGFGLLRATVRTIRGEHNTGAFDVIHGLWANASGLFAAVAGRLIGVPSVVTVAGGELAGLPQISYGSQLTWKGRFVVDRALGLATAVTSAAEFTRRRLLAKRSDARLIVLGADSAAFAPPKRLKPGPPWHLLHVASLNKVKDQPTLLRAFRIIHSVLPATHLSIVGEDTLGGAIQHQARQMDLDEAVTFHGFQTTDAVAQMLQTAHLLLHTSLFEDAGPLVFLEAAACAVPTVGTSVGLIDDLAGSCAVAVPVADHERLAEEAIALLRDESRRDDLGQRALAFAREHDANATARAFEALYDSVRPQGARAPV